jgi:methyltransferase (TIGR00027 family)
MEPATPSRTARAAAAHRAAHQLLEHGRLFADPLALRVLGEPEDALLRDADAHPERRKLRLFIAVRTRFAQDALAAAVAAGVRQLVILGAGLDTFAYRNPFGERLAVFEVDHPATQHWKRAQLTAAGIALPSWLTFTPVDFEREQLAERLAASGFDPRVRSFFSWLGVVPYLTEPAVFATLEYIAKLPAGAHVVFDYGDPPETLSAEQRAERVARAAHVAALGEAFVSSFEADSLAQRLRGLGYTQIEDLGPPAIRSRYWPTVTGPVAARGGHVIHACTS